MINLLLLAVAMLSPRFARADCGVYECDALYPLFLNTNDYDNYITSDCSNDLADNADVEIVVEIWFVSPNFLLFLSAFPTFLC